MRKGNGVQKYIFLKSLFFTFLFSFFYAKNIFSQRLPQHNAELNFTSVMFEYEEHLGADNYIITIKEDNSSKKIYKTNNKSLAFLCNNFLQFGKSYQWQYTAFKKNKKVFTSRLFNFKIIKNFLVDSANYKFAITKNTFKKTNTDIVLLDYLGIAVNRLGKPIWYMPTDSLLYNVNDPSRRSLRLTHDGNFTYLDSKNCYERDLFGNLLWEAPNDGSISGEASEFYHHDFRKFKNNTYLACSYKYVKEAHYFNAAKTWKVRYNTLIQYDSLKQVIWSWNEKDDVAPELIFEQADETIEDFPGTHLNGFDYNEKQNSLLLSFRNTARILKINMQTKAVQYVLGKNPMTKTQSFDLGLYGQHGPAWLSNDSIVIYNNNARIVIDSTTTIINPKVLIFKEPNNKNELGNVWEYDCKTPLFPGGQKGKEGYAIALKNGNILVDQGTTHRIFEVDLKKNIQWEMLCNRFDTIKKNWEPFINYRAFGASSLYPIYFTVQHGSVTKQNNQLIISFYINNDGTDDQLMFIDVYTDNNAIIPQYIDKLVQAQSRSSIKISLNPTNFSKENQKIYVKIFPVGNVKKARILTFLL
jgi:hypothetical protein